MAKLVWDGSSIDKKTIHKCGFMADPGRHPGSRDFMLDQPVCLAVKCVCNSGGYCFVPSRCKINDEGKCEGFKPRK